MRQFGGSIRKLIEFCYNPAPVVGESDLTRCETVFERDVASILIDRRSRVLPQYELAGKRIDLVVDRAALLAHAEHLVALRDGATGETSSR